ncbi:MAG: F0F1 ATP synthase subunit alpha [Ureaplasma sp.]|nr:F0F1 ATP synthase subunit alpha [Ureaplasma sp.]
MSKKEIEIDSISSLVSKELDKFKDLLLMKDEQGVVMSVGDGIATVSGLWNVMLNEIVIFENGSHGLVLSLDENSVGVVLLGKFNDIEEGQSVKRTNKVFEIPVGFNFVGRIIDATGKPIDGMGAIKADATLPIEKIAPGVMARKSVDQPLETGILSVDSMFPIGKGQRELIIGDRQTGKTTVAIDTIINQKGKDVYCIYVAIGQKNSTIANLQRNLELQGAMEYTTIVMAGASDLPALQYVAPYTGVTLAEYFMSKGKDVLIVYDDLSKHAVAYRTLSLLLKRPPGREAYPGDVFYLHSRLLERACRVNQENGGGSITALPIIETQAGDISAYIPTNVISITDGQIFMQTSLFNSGQRPAIDVGLSVSRVGGAAQIKSVKQTASSLKIELASFQELSAFAQFGSDLDENTKATLDHGDRIMAMLKQAPNKPLSQSQEAVLLFAIKERFIDFIPLSRVNEYKKFILDKIAKTKIYNELIKSKDFTKNNLSLDFRYTIAKYTLDFLGVIREQHISNEDYTKYVEELNKIINELSDKIQNVNNNDFVSVNETLNEVISLKDEITSKEPIKLSDEQKEEVVTELNLDNKE